jgi:hypothetical protein
MFPLQRTLSKCVMVFAVAGVLLASGQDEPQWRAPYEIVPAPKDGSQIISRLGKEDSAVWQEGDVLTIAHRDPAKNIHATSTFQKDSMNQIPGTDIWMLQLRMKDWNRAF